MDHAGGSFIFAQAGINQAFLCGYDGQHGMQENPLRERRC